MRVCFWDVLFFSEFFCLGLIWEEVFSFIEIWYVGYIWFIFLGCMFIFEENIGGLNCRGWGFGREEGGIVVGIYYIREK